MRRLIKWLAGIVVCALLLLGGVLAYIVFYLDPNEYRHQIEELASERGIDLNIRGNLSWTLWPRLGIEVYDLAAAAPASGMTEPAQLQSISVFVQLLPLLHKQVLIDGIDINNITWKHQMGVRQVSVANLSLRARDVNFTNNPFPFTVNGIVEMTNPRVTADINAQTVLAFDGGMQRMRFDDVSIDSKLAGVPLGDRTPEVSFKMQGDVDLEKHTMHIAKSALHLDKHRISFAGGIEQLGIAPSVTGELNAEVTGVNALLETLGLTPIATSDPQALQSLTLKTNLTSDAHHTQLNDIALAVDSTTFTGSLGWQSGAVTQVNAKLAGTALDVDRYRAPHKQNAATPAATGDGAGVSAAEQEVRVLPVADLRNINGTFDVSLNELHTSGLTYTNISTGITASVGNVVVEHFDADFYTGKLGITGNIDARDDMPMLNLKPVLQDVQLVPLLKDIAPQRKDNVMVSAGTLSLSGDLSSHGITRGELTRALNGTLEFSADNVVVDNVNIDREACQAASRIANKPLPAIQWAGNTAVKHFTGHANVVSGVIQNDVLQAQRDAASVRGSGEIVLLEEKYNYQLDVKLTGRGSSQFCSTIGDRWVDVEWPVQCSGAFGGAPKCGVDQKRMGVLAKQLAKGEVEKKLEEKIDKKLDGKESEAVKQLLKGLLR